MKKIDALRPMIFKISLALSLAFVVLLFNFSWPYVEIDFYEDELYVDESVEVIRTAHKKKSEDIPRNISETLTEKIEVEEVFSEEPVADFVDTIDFEIDKDDYVVAPAPEPAAKVPSPPPPAPEVEDDPILFPDKMPIFGDCQGLEGAERQACSEKELYEYLYANIDYPRMAVENGIEGRVVLRFVIGKDGSVRDLQLLRDIGAGCGSEALRVVEGMPKWTPGRQHNQPVSVIYTLPVKFEVR